MSGVREALATDWRALVQRLVGAATATAERDAALSALLIVMHRGAPTLLDVVTELRDALTSDEGGARAAALRLLSAIVVRLPELALSEADVDTLVHFMCARLADPPSAHACLDCLNALAARKPPAARLLDRHADRVARAFGAGDLTSISLPQPARAAAQRLVAWCFDREPQALCDCARELVCAVLCVVENEADPRNLLGAFDLVRRACVQLPEHRDYAEELASILCCYFPITFRAPANDPHAITAEQLNAALIAAMHASPAFAEHVLPFIFDDITSSPTHRLDGARFIDALVAHFPPATLEPLTESFWSSVRPILYEPESTPFKSALSAVKGWCTSVPRLAQTILNEFAFRVPDGDKAEIALRLLTAIAEVSADIAARVFDACFERVTSVLRAPRQQRAPDARDDAAVQQQRLAARRLEHAAVALRCLVFASPARVKQHEDIVLAHLLMPFQYAASDDASVPGATTVTEQMVCAATLATLVEQREASTTEAPSNAVRDALLVLSGLVLESPHAEVRRSCVHGLRVGMARFGAVLHSAVFVQLIARGFDSGAPELVFECLRDEAVRDGSALMRLAVDAAKSRLARADWPHASITLRTIAECVMHGSQASPTAAQYVAALTHELVEREASAEAPSALRNALYYLVAAVSTALPDTGRSLFAVSSARGALDLAACSTVAIDEAALCAFTRDHALPHFTACTPSASGELAAADARTALAQQALAVFGLRCDADASERFASREALPALARGNDARGWLSLVKGLAMGGSMLFADAMAAVTAAFTAPTSDETTRAVARALPLLLSCSTEEALDRAHVAPLLLSARFGLRVRRFWAQRIAQTLVPALLHAAPQAAPHATVAAAHMLRELPAAVLQPHLPGLLPLLIRALREATRDGAADAAARAALPRLPFALVLRSVRGVTESRPELVLEQLDMLVPALVALCARSTPDSLDAAAPLDDAEAEAGAVQEACDTLRTLTDYHASVLGQYHRSVLRGLAAALDHRKRAVRRAAVLARNAWFLMPTA